MYTIFMDGNPQDVWPDDEGFHLSAENMPLSNGADVGPVVNGEPADPGRWIDVSLGDLHVATKMENILSSFDIDHDADLEPHDEWFWDALDECTDLLNDATENGSWEWTGGDLILYGQEGPAVWCNSAGINVDKERDRVQVTISVGDPRGAFYMQVYKAHDGTLRLSVPNPSDSLSHMPLTELSPGFYKVG